MLLPRNKFEETKTETDLDTDGEDNYICFDTWFLVFISERSKLNILSLSETNIIHLPQQFTSMGLIPSRIKILYPAINFRQT